MRYRKVIWARKGVWKWDQRGGFSGSAGYGGCLFARVGKGCGLAGVV